MDVRQIQSFLSLYRTRNVTRTALELGLVQPAVSTQIAKQEADLGVRLFERTTRGVTPTAEGETLQQVESGILDFALVNHLQQSGALVVEPLVSEELVLVTAVASKVLGSSPVSLEELIRTNVIVPSRGQGLRVLLDRSLAQAGLVIRPRLELDALTPTLELVRRGEWAAILPMIAVARELEAGALKIHRLAEPVKRDLVIVHHPRRPLSLAARRLAGQLAEEAKLVVTRAAKVPKAYKPGNRSKTSGAKKDSSVQPTRPVKRTNGA